MNYEEWQNSSWNGQFFYITMTQTTLFSVLSKITFFEPNHLSNCPSTVSLVFFFTYHHSSPYSQFFSRHVPLSSLSSTLHADETMTIDFVWRMHHIKNNVQYYHSSKHKSTPAVLDIDLADSADIHCISQSHNAFTRQPVSASRFKAADKVDLIFTNPGQEESFTFYVFPYRLAIIE